MLNTSKKIINYFVFFFKYSNKNVHFKIEPGDLCQNLTVFQIIYRNWEICKKILTNTKLKRDKCRTIHLRMNKWYFYPRRISIFNFPKTGTQFS